MGRGSGGVREKIGGLFECGGGAFEGEVDWMFGRCCCILWW